MRRLSLTFFLIMKVKFDDHFPASEVNNIISRDLIPGEQIPSFNTFTFNKDGFQQIKQETEYFICPKEGKYYYLTFP